MIRTTSCWALLFLAGSAAVASAAEWQNSLKPAGPTAGDFALVASGTAACGIAPSRPDAAIEQAAAKELQHWIAEATGVACPIVGSADGPTVRIVTDEALGEEGYRIAIEGDDLVLAGGTTRGVMNAVFALLEEDLGFRFYTNESIRLPRGDSLSVQPVARQYVPPLRLRDPYYKVAFDPAWSLRNRTNGPMAVVPEEQGGHLDYDGMFAHSAAQLVPVEPYFREHPEYFYLTADGQRAPHQLCATDPEVLKIATATVLDTLAKHPHTEILSVSKNDNAGEQICHCERCAKLREAEGGTDIACQLTLVNGIAEAVEKSHPHVVIDTLAYLETVGVPKTVRPRKNVAVRFCNASGGSWGAPFSPASGLPIAATAKAWAAAHDQIYVWDYNVNFSHYLGPMPNVDVMAANIRYWVANGAKGVMLQGAYQGPGDGDELKSWVTAKLLWDPTRDEKALVADFLAGHYGPAGDALIEYQAALEGLKTKHAAVFASPPTGMRYPMDAPFFTKEFLDEATAIITRAKQAAAGDEALLRRVERAELPILYVKCVRGPDFVGETYPQAVAEFERIGKREGETFLAEGANTFESSVAAWRQAAGPKP